MTELSKLQIRAKVLSVVSQIKSLSEYTEQELIKFCEELQTINDKETLFDIFIKEYIKLNEKEFIFAGCLLKDVVNIEYIQDKVFEILKSNNYSDEAKYKLVQLLRIAGSSFDYNTIPQYFDNPQEVLDNDTKKLLESAVFNPEAMLDFLDFVSAVSDRDRNLLIQSLQLDYSGDMLANIIYPILYSDFDDKFKLNVINILSESKSSLAIAPFNYLIETSSNDEIINECKIGLKKLKLAGATEEKAGQYFKNIISETSPAEFFTTIPDGNGNQALLISRVNNKKEKFSLSAVVTNDKLGITDCFGFFNISRNELVKVINKFYQSEGKYKVSPEYIKTCINNAVQLTIQNKNNFPYEFICWDTLMSDIAPLKTPIKEEIENIVAKVNVNKETILNLLTKEYTFRWYIKPSENEHLKEITDIIINSADLNNIETINKLILDNINTIFDKNLCDIWKNRILQCIWLLYFNNQKTDAELFYTFLYNQEMFELFKKVVIQRSIFNYFISVRESSKESIFTVNIFRKKQIQEEKYSTQDIEKIICLLKKNWINE